MLDPGTRRPRWPANDLGMAVEWGDHRQTIWSLFCLLGVQYPKLLISQTLLFSSDHRAALILEERGSEMRNFALSD